VVQAKREEDDDDVEVVRGRQDIEWQQEQAERPQRCYLVGVEIKTLNKAAKSRPEGSFSLQVSQGARCGPLLMGC
jgi:hypothetical protein